MLKRTLETAAPEFIPGLLKKLLLTKSSDLEPLFKQWKTRTIFRQIGLASLIEELIQSLLIYASQQNTFSPTKILEKEDLVNDLLKMVRNRSVLATGRHDVSDPVFMWNRNVSVDELISEIRRIFNNDPLQFLIMTEYVVFRKKIKWIVKKYGLDMATIVSHIQDGFPKFKNESVLLRRFATQQVQRNEIDQTEALLHRVQRLF